MFSLCHKTEGIKVSQDLGWGEAGTIALRHPCPCNEENLNEFPNVSRLPYFGKEATEKDILVEKHKLPKPVFFCLFVEGDPVAPVLELSAANEMGTTQQAMGLRISGLTLQQLSAVSLIPAFLPSSTYLHHGSRNTSSDPRTQS